jgi:hypothetical protein
VRGASIEGKTWKKRGREQDQQDEAKHGRMLPT